MQVWLFDIMTWPKAGDRLATPYPGTNWDPQLGLDTYHGHLRFLQRADTLGYDGVCLAEHHSKPYATCPSPNVMAAAVATHTSRAKLVILGNCLPLHANPVRVAEELAIVDLLSSGRLVSGFIRGARTEWFMYSLNVNEIRGRFEEAWGLIVKAWTEPEPFAWRGQYYQYEAVSIMPRPVQQPHPPLIMAASTAESLEWCARRRVPVASSFATTASTRETFDYYRRYAQEECGWTPGPEYFMVSRQVYVAPTRQQACDEAGPHLMQFFTEAGPARRHATHIEAYRAGAVTERSYAYKSRAGDVHTQERRAGALTFESVQEDGLAIVGDPDHVIHEIRAQQEALGIGTFLTFVPFSTLPLDLATRSIELFAREVLPHLRDSGDEVDATAVGGAPGERAPAPA